MEKAVFQYSDFFNNDGGFDQIRRDFDKLGDDLIRKAKEIREQTKLFDVDQVDMIKDIEDKTESLTKAFKKYETAKIDLEKVEKAVTEAQEKQNQTQDEQIENLIKLEKELDKYKTDLAEANKLLKVGAKTEKDLNKQRAESKLNIKQVNKEIRDQQNEILKSNSLSKKEQKLAEARLILQKEEIRNREDLRERIKALRIVVDQLDFETEADQIAKFNQEIDELTQVLGDNSDKFIQSKINIGNYEESIVSALKNTNLFQGELGVLNQVIDKAIDFFANSEKANKKDAKAKEANTKATTRLGRGIKILNRIAKATLILALIAALASLASAFSQGRKGAILTQRALARFNVTVKVVINTLGDVASGLFDIFSAIGSNISSLLIGFKKFGEEAKLAFLELGDFVKDNSKEIAETEARIRKLDERIQENTKNNKKFGEGWDKITESIGNFRQRYDDAVTAIQTSDEGIINAFRIADEIKRAELNLVNLRKEVQLLEIRSEDSTISLRQQLELTDQLLEKRVELLQKESDIALKNLELANAQARVDAESAGFRLSEDDVQFARELLDLNQQLDPRNNPLNDEFLEETQNALKEYLGTLGEIEVAEAEIGKQRREISRDLFEQNLDLLIDLIDTEKNLSEQFVNDVTRSFKNRIDEFNRFLLVFQRNSQNILAEFNKEAENLGLDLDFDIQFDEEGNFKVFIGDAELAIDNIVELNEQLQATGLNEIDINRFREFIVETRNGVKDFKDLNKELALVGINVKELRENITVSQDELESLDQLQEKIEALSERINGSLSIRERTKVIEEIEALEKEKTKIEEEGEKDRIGNRIDAIDAELQTVEEESQRYLELIQERLDLEKQLRDKNSNDILEKAKEANKKELEEQKKLADDTRKIIDAVLDKAVEAQRERVEKAEERVDRQSELIDIQRQRAEQGLANTLAFEQRELGKREAERIKQEKRQERLEKIQALYSSYNNYASRGDDNPLVKALRDFSILEAITASFGDGGVVEDKLPTNGVFRGRSHQGKNGGIPILVEGREGILSAREMSNLGKDNFYKMKDMASMGKVDSNFFSKQRKQFVREVPSGGYSPELVQEVRDMKRAIEGKPVQQWDAFGVVNGTLELVETVMTKNKTKRNHYKVKKPRP